MEAADFLSVCAYVFNEYFFSQVDKNMKELYELLDFSYKKFVGNFNNEVPMNFTNDFNNVFIDSSLVGGISNSYTILTKELPTKVVSLFNSNYEEVEKYKFDEVSSLKFLYDYPEKKTEQIRVCVRTAVVRFKR